MRINSPKCSFVRVARWFDFTNFVSEKKNSQLYVVLYTEMSNTLEFKLWVFTFWNLSPKIRCRVALTKVFFDHDFLAFRSVFVSTKDKFVKTVSELDSRHRYINTEWIYK